MNRSRRLSGKALSGLYRGFFVQEPNSLNHQHDVTSGMGQTSGPPLFQRDIINDDICDRQAIVGRGCV